MSKSYLDISESVKLHISHCLYKGAYSGLCCGNVYRDKGSNDSIKDRYDLGTKAYPIIHGHTYKITVKSLSKDAVEESLKYLKESYNNYTILTDDNPLIDVFPKNRLIIWNINPTAEYMAKKWYEELNQKLDNQITSVIVEETLHNSVEYNENYVISTFIELPIACEDEKGFIIGSNYFVTVKIASLILDDNEMVIDFKKMKKCIHSVLDQYDHSMILKSDNPLVSKYKENYERTCIDFSRSRLFYITEIPTDTEITRMFEDLLNKEFEKEKLKYNNLWVEISKE